MAAQRNVVVRHRDGLHSKPLCKFVLMSNDFVSKITVTRGVNSADGKSLLGILSLGIVKNTDICVSAEGPDENIAVEKLAELIENNFDE